MSKSPQQDHNLDLRIWKTSACKLQADMASKAPAAVKRDEEAAKNAAKAQAAGSTKKTDAKVLEEDDEFEEFEQDGASQRS
eukprot:SAG11_NODE_14179_length_622_cov_0.978967_2_plen_81_part_00